MQEMIVFHYHTVFLIIFQVSDRFIINDIKIQPEKSWQGFRTRHETVTLLFHISFNNYHRKHLVTGKVKPHMYLIQDVHSKNKICSFKNENLVSNKIYNFIFWNENERKHDHPLFIYTLNFHNCIITLLTKYTNSIRNAILL